MLKKKGGFVKLGHFVGCVGLMIGACAGEPGSGGDADSGSSTGLDGGSKPGPDAGPDTVLIRAAGGGQLASKDGLFTLTIPPGALASDTTVSIAVVPRESWPAELAGVEPLGAVYDIQPEGLTFHTPAVVVQRFATTPAQLIGQGGAKKLAFHYSKRLTETATVVPTGTSFYADGSVEVTAVLEHSSLHWAETSYVPAPGRERNELAFSFSAVGGEHQVGEQWRMQQVEVLSLDRFKHMVGTVSTQVGRRSDSPIYVEPVGSTEGIDRIPDEFGQFAGYTIQRASESFDLAFSATTRGAINAPLPGWRCTAKGELTSLLNASISMTLTPFEGRPSPLVEGRVYIDLAKCTEAQVGQAPAGDEVLVGDVSGCTRSQDQVSCDSVPGVAARVAKESAERRALEREIAPGVFVSTTASAAAFEAGPPLELITSTQHGSAHFVNSGYAIDGLGAARAFAAPNDTLTVRSGTSTVVELPAPALTSLLDGSVLGELAGLETPFSFPDGAFDGLYIYGTGTDANGPMRLIRFVPASNMSLANNRRTAPLFAPAEVAQLSSAGITLDQLTFGPVRRATNTSIFGSPISIVAGRFLQLRPSALAAVTPLPEATVIPCGSLPGELQDRQDGADTAVVCIDPSNICRVTNDTFEDSPLLPAQCPSRPDGARALIFGESQNGSLYATPGPGWSLVWTTAPRPTGNAAPRLGVPEAAITRRVSDQMDQRIEFTMSASGVQVTSVARHTGPLPPYGEAFDCATTPLTMTTPHDESGTQFYARVCANLNADICVVHGDIETTPQTESCPLDYAVVLGVSPTLGPFASAGYPGGSFVINSASDGAHDGQILTGFAQGSSVRITVQDAQVRYFLVDFTYTGAGFVVNEARRR